MCYGCRYCLKAEDLLCKAIEQPFHVIESKMAARGNLKAIFLSFYYYDLMLLLPYPVKFELNRYYFKQFNVN